MDSSAEDVNKELRKVLELDASGSDSMETPPPVPPTPIPGSAPKPHPAVFGVNGYDKPLLASLAKAQTRDSRLRPSHGSSRGSLGEGGRASVGHTGRGSRVGGSMGDHKRGSGSGAAEVGAPILSLSPMSAPAARGLHPPLVTKPRVSEPVQPHANDKTEQNKR